MPDLFSSDKERKENRMDPRMRRSLPELEIIFTARGGRVVLVYSGIRSCCELNSSMGGRRGLVSDLIHK